MHTHTNTYIQKRCHLIQEAYTRSKRCVCVCVCVCVSQAMFDWYEAPPSERFNFMSFMQGSVARVVRKPVQVAFALDHVQVRIRVSVYNCMSVCVCVCVCVCVTSHAPACLP